MKKTTKNLEITVKAKADTKTTITRDSPKAAGKLCCDFSQNSLSFCPSVTLQGPVPTLCDHWDMPCLRQDKGGGKVRTSGH